MLIFYLLRQGVRILLHARFVYKLGLKFKISNRLTLPSGQNRWKSSL